jgi:hypothetical protein
MALELLISPLPTVCRTLVALNGAKPSTNTSVVRQTVGFLLEKFLAWLTERLSLSMGTRPLP